MARNPIDYNDGCQGMVPPKMQKWPRYVSSNPQLCLRSKKEILPGTRNLASYLLKSRMLEENLVMATFLNQRGS